MCEESCGLVVVRMDGVGRNMNAVDDDFGDPEGVTDAGKAWLSSLPALVRVRGGLRYHL